MKSAKIVKMQFKREWESPQGGSIFYHDIELDNGDKGSIGAKKQGPDFLQVGQALEYTIQETDKGNKIKRAQSAGGFKKKFDPEFEKYKQRLIVRQSCMKAAVELVAPAIGGLGDIHTQTALNTFDEIFEHLYAKVWEEHIPQPDSQQLEEMRNKALAELKPLMAKVGEDKFKEIYFHRYGQTYKSLTGKDAFQLRGLCKLLEAEIKENK